jgi:hypothetical protein
VFDHTLNQKVHNRDFLRFVVDSSNKDVSPITVSRAMPGMPGARLITSCHTLEALEVQGIDTVEACKIGVGFDGNESDGWYNQWLIAYNGDLSTVSAESDDDAWDYKLAIDWANTFYIIDPIKDVSLVRHLHERMENSGYALMPLQEVEDLAKLGKAFVNCSCSTFLHYSHCNHAMEDLLRKKIVVAIPITLNSNRIPHASDKREKEAARKKMRRGNGACYDNR